MRISINALPDVRIVIYLTPLIAPYVAMALQTLHNAAQNATIIVENVTTKTVLCA
jgi:hypothetical protein